MHVSVTYREKLTPRITARVIFTRSHWCQISPSARILASTARKSAHICLRASVKPFDLRPCFHCAAAMRALPSGVRGPVLKPPCSRHRVLPLSGGFWHAVPRRVLAPQLWRGRSVPKRHGMPFSRLLFVMLEFSPGMGFYNTPFLMMWLGMRGSVHGPRSKQNHPTQIELMQH